MMVDFYLFQDGSLSQDSSQSQAVACK